MGLGLSGDAEPWNYAAADQSGVDPVHPYPGEPQAADPGRQCKGTVFCLKVPFIWPKSPKGRLRCTAKWDVHTEDVPCGDAGNEFSDAL